MELDSDEDDNLKYNTLAESGAEDGSSSENSNSSDEETVDWQNEELHPHCCVESKRDFKRMEKKLQGDPHSLNRAQESENQDQPLHVAIYCEHINCVQYLLNEGANIDLENYEGKTPLERAIDKRCVVTESYVLSIKLNMIIKLLLKYGADVDYKGSSYPCTFFISKLMNRCDDKEMVKLFLEYGAKVEDIQKLEKGDVYHETPLYEALAFRKIKMAKLLFLYGATINFHQLPNTEYYCSHHLPILHAIVKTVFRDNENEYCKVINLYRQFGGDLRYKYKGDDALQCMVKEGRAETHVRLYSLLEYNASNPLSLQSICRLRIRSCIGREFKSSIAELPLPKEVKQFLKFKYD